MKTKGGPTSFCKKGIPRDPNNTVRISEKSKTLMPDNFPCHRNKQITAINQLQQQTESAKISVLDTIFI